MPNCWELRGCDDEMQGRCPHNVPGSPCPADCRFAACDRPTHHAIDDPLDALANPEIDRNAVNKEVCYLCTFFLSHGPTLHDPA